MDNYQTSGPMDDVSVAMRSSALVVYMLYGVGFVTSGLTWLIAIVMVYMKRKASTRTIYYSHFQWMLSVLWVSIATQVLLLPAAAIGLYFFYSASQPGQGFLFAIVALCVLLSICSWCMYRMIAGLARWNSHKPIDNIKRVQ